MRFVFPVLFSVMIALLFVRLLCSVAFSVAVQHQQIRSAESATSPLSATGTCARRDT